MKRLNLLPVNPAPRILRAVMTRLTRYWMSRPLFFGLLLAALTLRALVPAGYMPSAEQPFALELCRVGLPADLNAHDQAAAASHGADVSGELCVFGAAPSAGPTPQWTVFEATLQEVQAPQSLPRFIDIPTRRDRVRQPRAPPVLC